jgi:hypothetical protein
MSREWFIEKERGQHVLLTANAIHWTQRLTGIISSALAFKIIFSFIEGRRFSPEGSWALVQIIVVLYYLSWSLAALTGIKTQAVVLNSTGGISSKMPLPAVIALAVGLPIGAFTMYLVLFGEGFKTRLLPFWDRSITEFLVVLLAAFWLWDIAWHFLVRRSIRLMADSSKANLEAQNKRYCELEKIKVLETFIFGSWRIYRISFGLAVVVFLLFSIVFMEKYLYIPKLDVSIPIEALIAIVTFIFVLVSEGWIWIMRIRMISGIETIVDIGDRYNLVERLVTETVE